MLKLHRQSLTYLLTMNQHTLWYCCTNNINSQQTWRLGVADVPMDCLICSRPTEVIHLSTQYLSIINVSVTHYNSYTCAPVICLTSNSQCSYSVQQYHPPFSPPLSFQNIQQHHNLYPETWRSPKKQQNITSNILFTTLNKTKVP